MGHCIGGFHLYRTWMVKTGESLDVIDWKTSGAANLCKFTPPGLGASGGSLLVTAHIEVKREEGRILMWDLERPNPSQVQTPLPPY